MDEFDLVNTMQQQIEQKDLQLARAQLIINKFRDRTIEIQEQLLSEQVEHEITKAKLTRLESESQNGNTVVA